MARLGRRQPFPWRFRKALGIVYPTPPAPVGAIVTRQIVTAPPGLPRPPPWRFLPARGVTYPTYVPPTYTGTVNVEFYNGTAWVDISADVQAQTGHRVKRGISGNGPLDNVAGPGEYTFALQNWAKGARPVGYYSPQHANCRAGWTYGVPLRVTAVDPSSLIQYVIHRGKVRVIEPMAGKYLGRLVQVVSYDAMHDLLDADVRELSVREGLSEVELITAVLDSLPADQQPITRDFDIGLDTISYAFHDLGSGEKALSLINDIALDSYLLVAMKGDGTLLVRNRHNRADAASAGTFVDNMHGFQAPSSLDQAYNLVRVTIQPPTIDALPTTALYTDQSVRSVVAGQTDQFFVTYTNQTDPARRTLIGGLGPITLTYTANAQENGLGADLTSAVSVLYEPFATTTKFTITNNSGLTAYFADVTGAPALSLFGRGVYVLDAQTLEASSVQNYSTRPLSLSLRYQDDPRVAKSYAEFVESQRHLLGNQPQSVEFIANTPALVTHALSRDIGDVITVSETMTGFSSVEATIQYVELEIRPGFIVWCRWGLAPTVPFDMWTLDTSAFDDETSLGF